MVSSIPHSLAYSPLPSLLRRRRRRGRLNPPRISQSSDHHLPAVRTYQSDLCLLSITGTVSHDQAVTAAAADGGAAADEHLSSGAEAMVVETVFPVKSQNGNCSVSTKLFLPANKVREKARKIRNNRGGDNNIIFESENILPMTFKQVVLGQLWSFNLTILTPVQKENAKFTVNSSEEKLLSSLSEAICSWIINNTKSSHYKTSNPNKICSLDSSICLYTIPNSEIMDYKIQIMRNVFNNDIKFEGWSELSDAKCELRLTHSQMMDLANVLDMYCEDQFTLQERKLLIPPILEPIKFTRNNSSLLKLLFTTLSGFIVIGLLGIASQFFPRAKLYSENNLNIIKPSQSHSIIRDSIVVENQCKSVVKKIKEAFYWSGEIFCDSNIGTWIGTLPSYLRGINDDLNKQEFVNKDSNSERNEIASFQVVVSEEGEILGFQPTSRCGVNIWASHPLTKELYKGRNLSPGFLEPNLKIPRPKKVIVLELLMSTNPASNFALARPYKDPL